MLRRIWPVQSMAELIMTLYQVPKGTRDILWQEFYARREVADAILEVMEHYGFRQISTPAFERIEVLQAKAGDAIIEQIYDFVDKSGRRLGLRSDLTPAVGRVVASLAASSRKPIKIGYYGPVWRYEQPQAGRLREFYHINAEMFGPHEPLADAELLSCFGRCYEAAGLTEYEIHIGHRRFLEDFVRTLGVAGSQILPVMRVIDKRHKLPAKRFEQKVVESGLPQGTLADMMRFVDMKGDPTTILSRARTLYEANPRLMESLLELVAILDLLRNYEVYAKCRVDLGLARGFDYYTGLIFECIYPSATDLGSIGGGGRYDNLVEIYAGPSMPATGFSIGFERVMLLRSRLDLVTENEPSVDYYVVVVDATCLKEAISLAEKLRRQGKRVEMNLMGRSVSRQFQDANRLGVPYVIVIGPDELAQSMVKLKDMRSGEEALRGVDSF